MSVVLWENLISQRRSRRSRRNPAGAGLPLVRYISIAIQASVNTSFRRNIQTCTSHLLAMPLEPVFMLWLCVGVDCGLKPQLRRSHGITPVRNETGGNVFRWDRCTTATFLQAFQERLPLTCTIVHASLSQISIFSATWNVNYFWHLSR